MLALFTCVGISSCSDNDEDGTKGHQVLRLVDKSGNPIGGISMQLGILRLIITG